MKILQLQNLEINSSNQDIVYNSSDTLQTFALFDEYKTLLPDWATYTYTYSEKMLGPVMTMMRRGVLIDLPTRDRLVAGLQERLTKVTETFDALCVQLFDTDINWNSPTQLKLLFFSFMGIPEQTKSKKGETKVATDREVLERIVSSYPRGAPFAKLILRIRDLEGQIEFLTKGLSKENRFHTSYNLAGTETFRLSSNEHPLRMGSNSQNIPPIAREAFISDPGYTFFQADQQGAEARLVAYISGDPNYIEAVESGDVHTAVASIVFGFPPERELAEREYYRGYSYRSVTKKGTHGASYYAKAFTMAKNLQIELKEAERFLSTFFTKFPGISDWHAHTARLLQEKGINVNPFGIRRTFWGRRWDDATLREAIAYGPQSCVGVLTNIGLHKLWHKYEGQPGAPVQILMNGHDAVIGQIRTDLLDELVPQVLKDLEFPFDVTDIKGITRRVLIPFDMEVGQNWGKYSAANPGGLKKWKPPT